MTTIQRKQTYLSLICCHFTLNGSPAINWCRVDILTQSWCSAGNWWSQDTRKHCTGKRLWSVPPWRRLEMGDYGESSRHISLLHTPIHPKTATGCSLTHNQQCNPESHTLIPSATRLSVVALMQHKINRILWLFLKKRGRGVGAIWRVY